MLREVAVENYTDSSKALAAGADRIEQNDNLAVGGTTVQKGVMAESAKYVHEHGRSLETMSWPRGGNFVYNDTELKKMEADLAEAQALGVDGVAAGALLPDGTIDEDAMTSLIAASAGMSVVADMAFDASSETKQLAAIDWQSAQDVDRILTHGGPLRTPIETTLPHLQALIAHAAEKQKTSCSGGGKTVQNAATKSEQ